MATNNARCLGLYSCAQCVGVNSLFRGYPAIHHQVYRSLLPIRFCLGDPEPCFFGGPRVLRLLANSASRDDIALPGFVENPFAYMARASVFVLSSAWEGFGNVIAEALACGRWVTTYPCRRDICGAEYTSGPGPGTGSLCDVFG